MRGYLPDLLELPDLPIPRRVTRFPVGPSESSAQPRKRQRRAAGFFVWGWHDFELSESPNNRARIFGTILNFPSFSTCSCELFGQEIELSESDNIESSGSRLGKFNFLPFSASPMYLPPESSVSCHLHETAGALRRPRVLTLRFRAHTKNAGVLPLPCSCTNAGAPAPAPLLKTKAGRGLCPVPPFCVPISQQAAFVGAPAVGWFLDAARAFWLRPASDCRPLCQLAAHWWRAIELVGIRRAACSQLARCLQARACSSSAYGCVTWGPRNRPQTTYLRMTFWPLSSSLRAQWPQWYSASASDTVPSPNIKRCVPR